LAYVDVTATVYTVTSSTATPTSGTAFDIIVSPKDANAYIDTNYSNNLFLTTNSSGTGSEAPVWSSGQMYTFASTDDGNKTLTDVLTLNKVKPRVP